MGFTNCFSCLRLSLFVRLKCLPRSLVFFSTGTELVCIGKLEQAKFALILNAYNS